ncbi:MAG: PAS domain-containing protein [Desulfobacca sp.]|uniref:PAS domain-containing protein n=1 Tax=Desulfobacca sp. TaxID=2067990 RepID=UPI0040492777
MESSEDILQFLPIAVLQFDAQGRFLSANAAACEMFHLDCRAAQGKVHQLVLPDLNLANCSPAPEGKNPEAAGKPLGLFCDGRIVLTRQGQKLFCRSIYLPDGAATATRIVLLVEDMGDYRNLAGRVLEEERLMGVTEISNTMAHKLNQYLQVIMGYVSLMSMEMEPNHAYAEYLNKILEQLEKIRVTTHLLSNINNYAVVERPDGRRMFDLDHACLPATSSACQAPFERS